MKGLPLEITGRKRIIVYKKFQERAEEKYGVAERTCKSQKSVVNLIC